MEQKKKRIIKRNKKAHILQKMRQKTISLTDANDTVTAALKAREIKRRC